MRRLNYLALCALFTLIAAAPATQPSNTRTAQCTIDVWGGRDVDWQDALLAPLAGPAQDILHVAPDSVQQYLLIQKQSSFGQPGADRYDLFVHLDAAAQPAAQEFLDRVIATLPRVINQARMDIYLQGMPQKLLAAQREYEMSIQKLDAIRQQVGIATSEMEKQDLIAKMQKLEEQKEESALEAASLHAEQDQMVIEVSQMEKAAVDAGTSDAAATELQKIVALKEDELHTLPYAKDNPIFVEKSRDLQEQIAEARVQLLERQASVAQASGGDLLVDLRKRMLGADIDLAQASARAKALSERLDALAAAEPLVAQAQELRQEASLAQRAIQAIKPDLEERTARLRSAPPVDVRVVPESELKQGE
jgi:hypothetical protein